MLLAATWGLLAASSLLVGMAVALVWRVHGRLLGHAFAFGAGALLCAVSLELVTQAIEHGGEGILVAGMLFGAGVYVTGSRVLRSRTSSGVETAGEDEDDSRSIILGATLDGIPESLAIGASVATASGEPAALSATLIIAVALSNLPEAIGATAGMRASGRPHGVIIGIWALLVLGASLAAAVGYVVLDAARPVLTAGLDAFTAGAVVAMLTDTMIPDAYRLAGRAAGIVVVVGFSLALLIS